MLVAGLFVALAGCGVSLPQKPQALPQEFKTEATTLPPSVEPPSSGFTTTQPVAAKNNGQTSQVSSPPEQKSESSPVKSLW